MGVVQTYLSPKKDRTLSQHDGVCFLYSNFSPHKPIRRDAFMSENIGFPLGDSQVRPKSTVSNTKETKSIHFTFIWEDRLPQECLAHDHAQRVWFQKYLVNRAEKDFQ